MTKFRKSGNKFFIFLFLMLSLGVCISMADLFSSMIAVGGFNFTSNTVTFARFDLYAISTNSTTALSIAEDMSATTKDQGGAGYIYITNNNYYILASMYENLSDAEKVKSNILSTKPNTDIITINFAKLKFDNSLNSQEKEILLSSLNIFKATYKKLYDLAVSLDTDVKTEVQARLDINTIKNSANKSKSDFDTIFGSSSSYDLACIKNSLAELYNSLNSLSASTSTDYTFSTYIKHEYINDMMIYHSLCEKLNSTN